MWLSSCICVAPSHLTQVEACLLENPGSNFPHRSLKVKNPFSCTLLSGKHLSTSAPVGGGSVERQTTIWPVSDLDRVDPFSWHAHLPPPPKYFGHFKRGGCLSLWDR